MQSISQIVFFQKWIDCTVHIKLLIVHFQNKFNQYNKLFGNPPNDGPKFYFASKCDIGYKNLLR